SLGAAFWQFGGWSHTIHTPALDPQDRASGEWQSPHTVSRWGFPEGGYLAGNRPPATHNAKIRTLTDHNQDAEDWMRRPRRATLPRDTGLRQPVARILGLDRPFGAVAARRSDRRGQAPKGAGGMPRRHQFRAWKAAKCPGELPNELRARN